MQNNTVSAQFNLNGLIKRLNYTYEVEGLGGTWPATISPSSGEFTASGKTASIGAMISFCATTGSCMGENNLLPYNISKNCTLNKSDVFTYVRIKAILVDDPTDYVYSDPVYVRCYNCLPNLAVALPSEMTMNRDSKNIADFTASVSGLIPKETYNFTYSTTDSNWPIKIYPISGTINSITDNYIIPTKVVFCNSTGICQNGDTNVLDYTLDDSCLSNTYFGTLKLDIEPQSCEFDSATSNLMSIKCDDCVPRPLVAMPSKINLTAANNNYGKFTTLITGIIPDKQYSFNFKTLDANWPIILENKTGLFSSPTDTYCIESYIKFCEHTGVCTSGSYNVLDFTLPTNCMIDTNNYEARILADISAIDCDEPVISSNILHFGCSDCFPPSVDMTFDTNPMYLSKDYTYSVRTSFSNLEINKSYYYSINAVDSNWPVFVSAPTGHIQSTETYFDLINNISFCASTGACPSGYVGVMNYTISSGNTVNRYANKNYAVLQITLTEADCSAKKYVSSKLFLECNDCQNNGSVSVVSVDVT